MYPVPSYGPAKERLCAADPNSTNKMHYLQFHAIFIASTSTTLITKKKIIKDIPPISDQILIDNLLQFVVYKHQIKRSTKCQRNYKLKKKCRSFSYLLISVTSFNSVYVNVPFYFSTNVSIFIKLKAKKFVLIENVFCVYFENRKVFF